jgi:hypothetical protein
MLNEMRNVLPTLEPWREVLIHWVDDSGEHRATSYYSYDELHKKALKEVRNVWTITIFCERKPRIESSTVPKTPVLSTLAATMARVRARACGG